MKFWEKSAKISLQKHMEVIMMKLVSMLLTLCMVFCMLTVPAAADDLPVVKLDVGTTETYDDTNYKVDANTIILRAEDRVYELTGTTDRKILVLGTSTPAEPKTYHIRLNNAIINGGMTINNSTGAKLVIEVAAGTVNTVKRIYSASLTITGSGTLNMEDMGVTQSTRTNNPSSLYIEDTTINVNLPSTKCGQWEGNCKLAGSAKVTYTGCGDYSVLKLGQGNGITHSLTLKDNASLYCVQDDASVASPYSVSGLECFQGATITLQDNAYLEAEGRATSGDHPGCGVLADGDILVQDNATLKATAYAEAISTWGRFTVNGGKLIVKSENSNGVYSDVTIDISNNATVEATGYYPALFGNTGVTIANSTVKAVGTDDAAIFSRNTITLNNSIIDAEAHFDYHGISATNGVQVIGCWINTTGTETFDSDPNGIADSVLFNKKVGKVIGNASIPSDVTVESDMKLTIPAGTTLTVPADITLTNHGLITLEGTMNRDSTIICDRHIGGTATCVDKAKCDICLAAYGDVDTTNHSDLRHVTKVDATATADGNIEYWYCEGCGKYFSDKNGTKEIKKADIVTAKLKDDSKSPQTGDNSKPKDDSNSPQAGDNSNLALWIALLFISGSAAIGTTVVSRKKMYNR